jgi:AraC-like DNA-binding protein
LQKAKHVQSSVERILVGLSVEGNLMNENIPNWVLDLKHLLQDYIDADLSFSLSDISRELDLNPTYLSREFPKYFDNMSYGEYIRKLSRKSKRLIDQHQL